MTMIGEPSGSGVGRDATIALPSGQTTPHDARLVRDWFGDSHARLRPLLQQSHGVPHARLGGCVEMRFGTGSAGIIGHRLARHLGLPATAGLQRLVVDVRDDGEQMQGQHRLAARGPTLDLFFHYRAHQCLLVEVAPEQEITGS